MRMSDDYRRKELFDQWYKEFYECDRYNDVYIMTEEAYQGFIKWCTSHRIIDIPPIQKSHMTKYMKHHRPAHPNIVRWIPELKRAQRCYLHLRVKEDHHG